MKKSNILLFNLLLLGLFSVFASSCSKDGGIPVLTTTEVTEISQTAAKSGGNITSDGGSAITQRGVCWSTSENPTKADNNTINDTGIGSFTSELAGLTAGTTYYLRAYASNSNGTGYGSTMTFQTLDENGTFKDPRDDNVYKTVTIGNQVWMAENLRYLPGVVGPETGSNTEPYYYVYDYFGTDVAAAKAMANYSTYGVLYNWPAAMAGATSSNANPSGVQGVCPTGWHLPSYSEWIQLWDNLGGKSVAGGKLKEAGTTHWISPNTGATNESGFTALPGGDRRSDGIFDHIGYSGFFWSSTESNSNNPWYLDIYYTSNHVSIYDIRYKEFGVSVRCIRD